MTELPSSWVLTTVSEVTLPVGTVDAAGSADRDIKYIDIGSIDNQRNRIADPKELRLSAAPSRARWDGEWAIIKTTAVQPMSYLGHECKPLPSNLQSRPSSYKAADIYQWQDEEDLAVELVLEQSNGPPRAGLFFYL